MKEIEILFKLTDSIEECKQKIELFNSVHTNKLTFNGSKRIIDTYYESKFFKDFSSNEYGRLSNSFRIREKSPFCYITTKKDVFDNVGTWLYSDEFETKIDDVDAMKKIVESLYLVPLVIIDNTKHVYVNDIHELVLEVVKDLGCFIEIEYKSENDVSDQDVLSIKQEIRDFVYSLGINVGEELKVGKPELMLKAIKTI